VHQHISAVFVQLAVDNRRAAAPCARGGARTGTGGGCDARDRVGVQCWDSSGARGTFNEWSRALSCSRCLP